MSNCFSNLKNLEEEVKRLSKYQGTEDTILSIIRTFNGMVDIEFKINQRKCGHYGHPWMFDFLRYYLLCSIKNLEKYPNVVNFCFQRVIKSKKSFDLLKPEELVTLASIAAMCDEENKI